MEAIRVEQTVVNDGEIVLTGLPYEKGQVVEVIVFAQPQKPVPRGHLTVGQLRQSGIIGLWKDRTDIQDSSTYARQLREQAQKRVSVLKFSPLSRGRFPATTSHKWSGGLAPWPDMQRRWRKTNSISKKRGYQL